MSSFNFDFNTMLATAASMFNAFAPLFLGIAGISLGLGLVVKVISEVRKAI